MKAIIDTKYFNKIDTDNKAYILGLIASDGSIKNKYTVRISLRDKHILEDINALLFPKNVYRVTQNKCDKMFVLNLCSKDIIKDLNNQGIYKNKTYNLKYNFSVPDKVYPSFVLGYFDGDGCIRKNLERSELSILGTKDVITGIRNDVDRLAGVEGRIYTDKNQLYKLCYAGKNKSKKFVEWLYSGKSICLNRKRIIANELIATKTLKENIMCSIEEYRESNMSIREFSEVKGIKYNTMRSRLRRHKCLGT